MLPILLVEDDDVDANLMMRSLRKLGAQSEVYHATDGIKAFEMLTGQPNVPHPPQPCLIFLDINLPRMTGLELLHKLQDQGCAEKNVVYVLTTSMDHGDSEKAMGLGAQGCIDKCDDSKIRGILREYAGCTVPPASH